MAQPPRDAPQDLLMRRLRRRRIGIVQPRLQPRPIAPAPCALLPAIDLQGPGVSLQLDVLAGVSDAAPSRREGQRGFARQQRIAQDRLQLLAGQGARLDQEDRQPVARLLRPGRKGEERRRRRREQRPRALQQASGLFARQAAKRAAGSGKDSGVMPICLRKL